MSPACMWPLVCSESSREIMAAGSPARIYNTHTHTHTVSPNWSLTEAIISCLCMLHWHKGTCLTLKKIHISPLSKHFSTRKMKGFFLHLRKSSEWSDSFSKAGVGLCVLMTVSRTEGVGIAVNVPVAQTAERDDKQHQGHHGFESQPMHGWQYECKLFIYL